MRFFTFSFLILAFLALLASCTNDEGPSPSEPAWVADAIFYQIFPERFRNGDPSNDPTHATLEYPENVPDSWRISPWTGDWYERDDWEVEMGPDFYENGVFDRRYGGDLQGVIDKLDYLKDLGINTLYFNPLFYARSLHKYDGNTFHHIDPQFGPDPAGDFDLMAQETSDPATWHDTAADQLFFKLVDEAHAREMRIVIDGVWNHTGRDFFAFQDIVQNQENSPYKDWYIINSFDDPATSENEFSYEGWWGVETLPLFADTPDGEDLHPGPKAYVFDATRKWMDPNGDGDPSDGVDGWRLDVAPDVPLPFWYEWNTLVKSLNPEAYTVSEVWFDASTFLQEGNFTATMNYHGFAFPVKGFMVENLLSVTEFVDILEARRLEYPDSMQFALQNLVDSHDTDRLASMVVNAKPEFDIPERADYDHQVSPRYHDFYTVRAPNETEREIQKLVAFFQATFLGPPMYYYGTEAGMWGADDPDDRMPMVWEEFTYDDQVADPRGRDRPRDPVAFDQAVFDYYQSIMSLRSEQAPLRRGDLQFVAVDDAANSLAFTRSYMGKSLLVAINRSAEAQDLQVDSLTGLDAPIFTTQSGSSFSFTMSDDGGTSIHLPALSGSVWQID